MDQYLVYSVLLNEEEKVIRVLSEEEFSGKRKKSDRLLGQTEGESNRDDLINIIQNLRPDLKII